MKALVTGGSGFVGFNIVKKLLKEGYEVATTSSPNEQKLPEENLTILPSNFGNLNWEKIGKIDVLFHQAAINDTTLMDRNKMLEINLEHSKKLFSEVAKKGCKKIVYASSTAAYGDAPAPYREDVQMNPLNPYGESKKLLDGFATKFAEENPEITIVGLRYCNVYGQGEQHKGKRASMIYQLAQQMKLGDPKIFKYGEQKRDYIYVKDVVRANLLAAQAKESCIVNCGSGKATTFNDLIKILNKTLKVERKPIYIDNPFIGKYQDYTECNMELAKEKINFVPEFNIQSGIEDYAETGTLV